MHSLIRNQLRAASKYGVAGGKLENGRGQIINLHILIASDPPKDTCRFSAEREPRSNDRIATNVHQRAAAIFGLVANVIGITIEVTEKSTDRPQFSDPPR